MAKSLLPPYEALYPVPVVLVSCSGTDTQKNNIITIAWCGIVCSKPPQISISIRPSRFSHKIISVSREFVVNIPTKSILKAADLCGMQSGAKTDKFREAGLTPMAASKVSSPLIKECPVNIECVLKHTLPLGAHDMFIGEVVAVHIDEELLGPDGKIDYAKASPFVFNQGEYWDLDKKIGFYGCSSK